MRDPIEHSSTWEQVSAFRLARHYLLQRAPARELVSVAGRIAGVQAQLLSAAQIGLWSRVGDLELSRVEKAMSQKRLVKATCMRQTLFLVPAAELAVFVRGSARRAEKDVRWTLGKGVPERAIDAAIEATLSVLDEPLTRAEIAGRVCRKLGVQKHEYEGGGWGNSRRLAAVPVGDLVFPVVNLLQLVSARGVVCYGPGQGRELTFVRADAWLPRWQDLPREQAEQRLLRKYLQAFGPATVNDFALWAGITLRDAREIWSRGQSSITPVSVEGWQAGILREDLDALAGARLDRPVVRLLPYFDTFLLGHKERSHLAGAEHRPHIYRPQGWISPVVLVDGGARGVWEYSREKDRLHVQVKKFSPLSSQIKTLVREQAQDLARFLGAAKADVSIL